ncbi:MAG: lytic transglycosylase domain-containing protein [Candidatus Caccovivens sp.]
MKWFFAIFFSLSFIFLSVFGVNCVYGYLFPLKYQEEVASACNQYDVDKAIVFSVINVESHFNKNAISSRGAVGLMQVMPSTAQYLAEQLNLNEYDLTNPEDNILFGTYYIHVLLKKFENIETALCAYNAGPTNVKGWLADAEKSDDGITLKNIPFEETRNYIEKYRKNFKYYITKFN